MRVSVYILVKRNPTRTGLNNVNSLGSDFTNLGILTLEIFRDDSGFSSFIIMIGSENHGKKYSRVAA